MLPTLDYSVLVSTSRVRSEKFSRLRRHLRLQKNDKNVVFRLFSNDREGEDMLRNLTRINKPLRITLEQMMRLIGQCDLLDPTRVKANDVRLRTIGAPDGETADSNGIQTTTSNSLYSGILPGILICTRCFFFGELSVAGVSEARPKGVGGKFRIHLTFSRAFNF